jgi:NAD(P)H-nitrite reductase large subunit
MSDDLVICRCEEVTREEIEEAIRDGARSVDSVKRRTRAGMGLCQGKTCARMVAQMISQATGTPPAEIAWPNSRPPVRPIKVGDLAAMRGGGSADAD